MATDALVTRNFQAGVAKGETLLVPDPVTGSRGTPIVQRRKLGLSGAERAEDSGNRAYRERAPVAGGRLSLCVACIRCE
jgi:hypothetical protein